MSSNNHLMYKSVSAFGFSLLADKFVNQNQDITQSLYFAGATTAGITLGSVIGDSLPQILPSVSGIENGKTLLTRTLEISSAVGAGYALNRYVLKNDLAPSLAIRKMAILAGVDVLSEYFADYMSNEELNYITA